MADITVPVTEVLVSRMARVVARNLIPLDKIRESFQLTISDFEKVVDNPIFQKRLVEELSVWNNNPDERIRSKSAVVLEEGLVELDTLIHDDRQPLAGKVEALKFVARLAHMGESNPAGDTDKRVVININMGDAKLSFENEKHEPRVLELEPIPSGN